MSTFIARLLGTILFVAGFLKGLGFRNADLSGEGALIGSHWFSLSAVLVELTIGLWLIVGLRAKHANLTAMGLFLVLAVVAASKGFRGDKSCECASTLIEINPWFAFLFDLAAVIALWRGRSQVEEQIGTRKVNSTALAFFALSMFAMAVSGVSAIELLRIFFPNQIVVQGPSRIVVDHADRGKPLEVAFLLFNPTSRDILVQHVNTDCARVTAKLGSNDQRQISSGHEATLLVQIKSFDDFSSSFLHRIQVETDSGNAALLVSGTLPVSQTAFYRPQKLLLDKDSDGNWRERTVRLRLPKQHGAELAEKSIKLSNCVDSKAWLVENQPTANHLEYTLHFVLSPKTDSHWSGGSIDVCTHYGDITIPVSILKPLQGGGAP